MKLVLDKPFFSNFDITTLYITEANIMNTYVNNTDMALTDYTNIITYDTNIFDTKIIINNSVDEILVIFLKLLFTNQN